MSSSLDCKTIDWANETHRRIVVASLVEGAYDLEHGRQRNDKHGMKKAEAFVGRFGFEISSLLEDANDQSYFGTILKYKYELPNCNAPKFVIAFRGTCLKPKTMLEDLILDMKFIFHELQDSTRCEAALHVVQEIISTSGDPGNVWLAGHSLGAAIALIVGRNMVMQKGIPLTTYLFNPPFFSLSTHKPFNIIYWAGRSVVTAGIYTIYHHSITNEERDDVFNKLKSWSPHLFVNKRDSISSGYIWYFRQRKIMASRIENVATQHSVISLLGKIVGKDFEPIHLIPSANLTKTKGKTLSKSNHGIRQWHSDVNLPIENKSCLFNHRT